jgi:hypothetical protein
MTSVFFKPAQRKNAKLRLAVSGPTGAGKTYGVGHAPGSSRYAGAFCLLCDACSIN